MTSKTFECMNPVVELTITKGSNGNINFIINHELRGSTKATLEKSAGADAALAILEAAGYDDMADDANLADVHAFNAMHKLQESVDTQERATAEAKEQAELEAEALEFMNAVRDATGVNSLTGLPAYASGIKSHYLIIARKAREMRKS